MSDRCFTHLCLFDDSPKGFLLRYRAHAYVSYFFLFPITSRLHIFSLGVFMIDRFLKLILLLNTSG